MNPRLESVKSSPGGRSARLVRGVLAISLVAAFVGAHIQAQTDLALAISEVPAVVGGYAHVYLAYYNLGPRLAHGVKVKIRLTGVSAPSHFEDYCGAPVGGVVDCLLPYPVPLEILDPKYWSLSYYYSGVGVIGVSATIEADEEDPNPANNSVYSTTKFYQGFGDGVDLALTVDPVLERVTLGSTLNYRFHVVHDVGYLAAQRVEITDRLPEQLEFESSTSGCHVTAGVVHCPLGELQPGQSVDADMTVRAVETGLVLNYARVSSNVADPFDFDNLVTTRVTVVEPNVPPTVQVAAPISALSGEAVALEASFEDPEGDPVSLQWRQTGGPPVRLSDFNSPSAGFTAPFVKRTTIFSFVVQASDGQSTVELPVEVAVSPATFYFPQLGTGVAPDLRFQTEFSIANTGADAEFLLEFFTPSGEPLALDFEGGGSADSLRTPLASGASLTFRTSGDGPLRVGYARLRSTVSVGAIEVFSRSDDTGVELYETGVPASTMISEFSVQVDSTDDRDTGVALLNPPCLEEQIDCGPANLQLRLFGEDSTLIASAELVLEPGRQIAQFAREFFPGSEPETLNMRGLMAIVSDRPLVALTLRQNHPGGHLPDSVPTLFALPVLPGAPAVAATQ